MPAQRVDDSALDPSPLEVDLQADPGEPLRAERERVVERDEAACLAARPVVREDE